MKQDTGGGDELSGDDGLLLEFTALWQEADELWERNREAPAFHGYVSADYHCLYRALTRLQGHVLTILEWGSGLGIMTIMASRMGFEAYGIEAEAELVDYAETFAEAYGANPHFVVGSFIPDDFEWQPMQGDEAFRTMVDVPAAYDEMGMEIRDFDLIYAYPWPDEQTFFQNIVRRCGHDHSLFLCYDAREGLELLRVKDGVACPLHL